jgi:glucosamine--fructose-6-phosphate aminotransferase (isomerizing)
MSAGQLMAAEMAEQPEVLARLVARRGEIAAAVRERVGSRELGGIVIVARGSSNYAAVYGRYVLELHARRPVTLAAPSLFTHYGARTPMDGWLAVAISQSGRTPEITRVADALRGEGAKTIAVTNDADSPLALAADWTLALEAGEERAVPATKTMTAQLAAVALLAEALGDTTWPAELWAAAIDAVRAGLDDGERAQDAARRLDGSDRLVAIGRGMPFAVALEAALKIRETTGVLAEGWSASDYRHGPIRASGPHVPAIAVHVAGPTRDDVCGLVSQLRARGSPVVEIADEESADLPIAAGLPEDLAVLPGTVRAQQLALALALGRGLDPDAPTGLRKVTAT